VSKVSWCQQALATPTVRIQSEDFDLQAEIEHARKASAGIGAVVTFSGICRDEGGILSALHLEHYPGMAHASIQRIADAAIARFGLNALSVIHRYGTIPVGDNIVLVVAAAPHRQSAFDGANYVMDYLKTEAPFWKKMVSTDGTDNHWVEPRNADTESQVRWIAPPA
jgi:molybdopterin synthase catalytic subunit